VNGQHLELALNYATEAPINLSAGRFRAGNSLNQTQVVSRDHTP
jgi:hypothetical protein